VLARYFAGIRLFWPQWLQARTTGKKHLHHTNRRHSFDACAVSEVYSSKSKIRRAADTFSANYRENFRASFDTRSNASSCDE
jgi:hypothetical protein